MRNGLLVYALCALLAWLAWPWIQQRLGPDLTTYMSRGAQMRVPHMRLDPNEVSPNIEDRRPHDRYGNLTADAGGGEIGRIGPSGGGFPGGPEMDGREGGGIEVGGEYTNCGPPTSYHGQTVRWCDHVVQGGR
jgi:hypothetical protein